VFEKNLKVLPTFALTRAQWAPDVLLFEAAVDGKTVLSAGRVLFGSTR